MTRNRAITILSVLAAWTALCAAQTAKSDPLYTLLAGAARARDMGNFQNAAELYKQAVKLRPGVGELWANLGVTQYQAGQSNDAVQSLIRAQQIEPKLFVPDFFLGLAYARLGQPERALSYLIAAERKNASDSQVPLALGSGYAAVGKQSLAAAEYGRAAKLDPQDGRAWFGLGISSLEQVENDSRTLSEQSPDSPYGKDLMAEALSNQGRLNEARDTLKSLLENGAKLPCLRSRLGLLALRRGDTAQAKSEFLEEKQQPLLCSLADLGLAMVQVREGSDQQALSGLIEVWKRDAGFFDSHVGLLGQYLSKDDLTHLINAVEAQHTARLVPDDLFTALRSGHYDSMNFMDAKPPQRGGLVVSPTAVAEATRFYSEGRYGRCEARLQGNLEKSSPRVLELLASCSFLTGDFGYAAAAAEAILSRSSHSKQEPVALYWAIQANQRRSVLALERFEEISPDSVETHLLLGDIYRQRQRYDEAQTEYGKALAIDPGNFAALFGLASAYRLNSHLQDAASTCRKALLLRPEDPEANLLLGEVLVSTHAYIEAEPFLLRGLQCKPQMRAHAHALLGTIYANAGRNSDAIAELRLGLESDEDGSIHYRLATLYRQAGDKAASSKMIEQSKALAQGRRDRAAIAIQGSSPDR